MGAKKRIIDFFKRQRRHLQELQEASFDRGEKEFLKIMNDENIKDTFPVPGGVIIILVWSFMLLFPLMLMLDPSNNYVEKADLKAIVAYYVPLLSTVFVFGMNQSILVPKCFFKKKYVKYIIGNGILVSLCLFFRELLAFLVERGNGESIGYFFNTYIFESRGHFTGWTVLSFHIILAIVCLCSILISILSRQTIRAFVIRETGRARLAHELEFLKQQLSPHFLFNTLNNISTLISIDSKRAEKAMSQLSQLLRVTLYQTDDKYIPIKEELEILEKYADLEKLRHDDNFEFIFEKKIEDSSKKIEPLLLMPLLENAMKHCVNPNGKSFTHVFVEQTGDQLYVKMENSNFPRKPKNDGTGGFGLTTFEKRLNLRYKDSYSYNTYVENGTYICELQVTLK